MNYKNLFFAVVLVFVSSGVLAAQVVQTLSDKNKNIVEQDAAMQKAVNDGVAAFAKKDYAGAIDTYKKAYDADRTHPTAPLLHKNIAAIKLHRGVETFNAGVKAGDEAMMTASKTDLLDAEEMCNRALTLAQTHKYTAEKTGTIISVQKQIFQKISYVFFYIGTVTVDKPTLQKSADASKAFLALATANEPNRSDAEQILAELKSSHNIVPK